MFTSCECRNSSKFVEDSVTGGFLQVWCPVGESVVERIYQLLLTAGYPERGIDWLRQHRLPVIVALAIGSWAVVIGLGWVVWSLLT